MTYTIDNETNQITAHLTADHATTASAAETFDSEAELSELAASWPGARLIEIWNALPGITPVKKFKDRGTGVARIWKAIQPAEEAAAPEAIAEPENEALAVSESEATIEPMEKLIELAPDAEAESTVGSVEPEVVPKANPEASPEPEPTATPEAAQAPDVAPEEAPATTKPTRTKKAPKAAKEPEGANVTSKTAKVIELIEREGGASLAEIMEATGWQAHSVRGFISGTLTKKMETQRTLRQGRGRSPPLLDQSLSTP